MSPLRRLPEARRAEAPLRVAALLLAGVVACGDAGDPAARSGSGPPSGAEPPVHRAGDAPEGRLELELEIGRAARLYGEPAADEFGRVAGVVADAAGRIYVSDDLERRIRVFGADGTPVRSLLRSGAGPGEVEGLHGAVWLAPDTLLVADYGNARLTGLTTDGEPVGQWRWARITGTGRFLFNGGEGEALARVPMPSRSGDGALASVWVRYSLAFEPDTVAIPADPWGSAGGPRNALTCRGERLDFFFHRFAASFLRVPAPGLERAVALSDAYRIAFLDPAGDTVRVLTRSVPRVPVPDTAWAVLEERLADFRTRTRGAECEGEIVRPPHVPVLRDLFFDHHGRLLVEYVRPAGPAFDLYDRSFGLIGTFPAPDRDPSVPPYLYGDRLYTVARDSLDVQRVRVHRLHLAGQGAVP